MTIQDKLKELKLFEDKIIKEFREWLKDKLIPVNERWKVFIESGKGNEETFIVHFKSLSPVKHWGRNPIEDYLHENLERYYSIAAEDIVEMMEEEFDGKYGFLGKSFLFKQSYNDNDIIEYTTSEQDIINFKEECLEKFIKSFKMDW